MSFRKWQRKWVELEEPKDGVSRCHGYMENEMYVFSIVEVRGFDLKQVGGVPEHQLLLMRLGLASSGVEDVSQLCAV